MPFIQGIVEYACFFQCGDCKAYGSCMGYIFAGMLGVALGERDLVPKALNGVVKVIWCGQRFTIGFNVLGCHDCIVGMWVGNHVVWGDISTSKICVFKGRQVLVLDGFKDLLL